ncbi:MAG: hypothetical protein HQM01_11445 [Magnetococcales bacterium]|nr:hypothetical protein [Magnetococcales bacterium]
MPAMNTAIHAFIARKQRIDMLLARLQELSDDHFNVDPEEVHWGHEGSLAHIEEQLQEIADFAFQEGEYA